MAGDKIVCNTNCVENGERSSDNGEISLNILAESASASSLDNFPCPEFRFNTRACYICNGYYGPCFGEPVCATCHAFLFPNEIGLMQVPIFSEKTDDEDSGNDEPTDLYYNADRRASQPPNQNVAHNIEPVAPNPQNALDHNAVSRHYLRCALRNFQDDHLLEAFNNVPFQNNFRWNNANQNQQENNQQREVAPPVEAAVNENFADQDLEDELLPSPAEPVHAPEPVAPADLRRGRVEEGEPSQPRSLSDRIDILTNHKHIEHEPVNETGLVDRLPPEVLLAVFSHLDDVSLWSATNVCRRWCNLLLTHVTDQWQRHVIMRWPLYRPIGKVTDWYKVYDQLASAAPCRTCLAQTSLRTRLPRMEETSWRKNRLRIELKSLQGDPPEGIKAIPLDDMCCHWQATITGPVGSPYEGGLFYLYLQVPYSYPMCPPVVRFLTKILHPNVSRHGDVGIDSIHHNWSLALTISKVLISVQSLLTDPYCQVCMEPELGDMYMNDREKFEEVARAWTWKYAMNDVIVPT